MALWTRDVVQPLAHAHFGQKVVELENLGSYNCRKIADRQAQSEHSTANAIDISAFVLADGPRPSLINDWEESEGGSEGKECVSTGDTAWSKDTLKKKKK